MGAERLYLLPFGVEMANFTYREFARDVLANGLGVRHVAVGFDTTFGKGRTGDPEAMRRYGEEFGFTVSIAPQVKDAVGGKISSTAIREALHAGKPEVAARLIGRPFAIEGIVQRGAFGLEPLGRQAVDGDHLVGHSPAIGSDQVIDREIAMGVPWTHIALPRCIGVE